MRANLGLLASMALAANAILIPPEIMADSLGDDLAMESLGINPFKRSVALDCPKCPSATQEGNALAWAENVGSTLLLDFEIGPREDRLDIDGAQLYPPTFGHLSEAFYVTQFGAGSGGPLRLRVTGYTFRFSSAQTVSEAGNELLPMTFHITGIEGKNVDPPAITINLLKDASGRLMIASFETKDTTQQDQNCEQYPLLCKWKALFADRIESVKKMGKDKLEDIKKLGKGCHKRKGSMELGGKPHHPHHHDGDHHHHKGDHHHHHGGDHHHHHRKPQMLLGRVFFSVLVPVLIGIFAGTLTYLIGMALGCLIAVVVAKVRGQGAYEAVALEDDEESAQARGEKEVYAELPEYDSPPVYEEVAEKEVVDDAPKSNA